MVNIDGALAYTIFYVAFLILNVTIGALMPFNLIEGLNEEQIEALTKNVELPAEPGLTDYFLFPFSLLYSILSKLLILLTVSTAHQIIGIILTPFTIGMLMVIVSMVRGN